MAAHHWRDPLHHLPGRLTRAIPLTVLLLIAINIVVFSWTRQLPDADLDPFAFTPARYGAEGFADWQTWAAPIAHMFIHADGAHLIGNMLMLAVFGSVVARSIGAPSMLVGYLASGSAGALAFYTTFPDTIVGTIAASGAITGLVGGTFVLIALPDQPAHRFLPLLPAGLVWIGIDIAQISGDRAAPDGVAWESHVGGLIGGTLIMLAIMYRAHLRRFRR